MANLGRGRRSFGGRAQRRQTTWLASADVAAVVNIPNNANVLVESFTGAQVEALAPFTITRVRGIISIKSDQLVAVENPYGAIGMMVVSEQARAAGAASIPGPITNQDAGEWFVWQPVSAFFEFVTGAGFDSAGGRVFEFDSKAMRKVQAGDAIVVMAENETAAGFDIDINYRMLLKLH